jgi:carnitine-CoA ligase
MVIGAAAGTELIEQFEERFGVAVLDVYGMTETGPTTAITWSDRRPGSCGRPVPWYDVRVVDEHDNDTAEGEIGEIIVRPARNHVMMEGYWNNPEAMVKAIRNLWFHTGDLARRDADGYLWFVERGTDSIRRRGENVSSFEVEQALLPHPAVSAVAAFPIASELGEDEVAVAVILEEGVAADHESLIRWCEPRLAYFAIPRYVRFVTEMPLTANGKVRKAELRAEGITAETWDREAAGVTLNRTVPVGD